MHDEVKAEVDAADRRGMGRARPRARDRRCGTSSPRSRRGVTEKNVVTAIHDTLHDEMAADERVVVLGEDVGARGGVFRVTAGLHGGVRRAARDRHAARRSRASSASRSAWRCTACCPVAEIQFADFIHPAFDQIVSEAARMRYRIERRLRAAAGDPRAVRRRRPRRPLPLAVDRGVLRARPGPQGRRAVDAGRRRRDAARAPSATPTRCCSSSTRRPTG